MKNKIGYLHVLWCIKLYIYLNVVNLEKCIKGFDILSGRVPSFDIDYEFFLLIINSYFEDISVLKNFIREVDS